MAENSVISFLANRSHGGLQEDAISNRIEKGVFALADGFGSGVVGSHAARIAVDSISSFLVRNSGDLDATLPFVIRRYFSLSGNMAFNALIHANRELLAKNKTVSLTDAGGASAIAALLDDDFLAIASVGVCSARLLRGTQPPVLLNRPRSYQQLRSPSEFCGLDVQDRAHLDVPLMALGIHEHFEPEVFELQVQRGDWILLHSDGLSPGLLEVIQRVYQQQSEGTLEEVQSRLAAMFESQMRQQAPSDHLACTILRIGELKP